ncbi:glycine cleavage system transcriptional repressor [Nonomuraea sp. K274]|uniref:Glycine cleavage system transcriptional repressor n=1 Tax=Nonomuraea cypriaca TaxID=1187855 RepID=A0A931AGP6_9ACTN|nr:ACT domain-containing protein [Nonomuraea cypriaca]MBF8188837.1 glycine cleavage system transcriptional repressor [Nonomuraea cypriaca]
MGLSAVTVLGVDRPGVIAAVTGSLADCGANIQDSTMTLLGGHVAMMLLVSGELDPAELMKRLRAPDLVVTAAAIEARRHFCEDGTGLGYVLTVHGPDRTGIVRAISEVLAADGGNITGMSTRLTGRLYVLIADVELPKEVDVAALMRRLAAVGAGLESEITFRPVEPDLL